MFEEIYTLAKKLLKQKINFELETYTEINAGVNNKLFKLEAKNGNSLLLKIYHNDDRQRLQREFSALRFLNHKHFEHIPTAYIRNDKYNFAVYSFESGKNKLNEEISKNDIVIMAQFLAKLHTIKKTHTDVPFLPAILSCFSLQDYVDNIHFRLQRFSDYLATGSAHEKVQAFHQSMNLKTTINSLVKDAIKDIGEEELKKKLTDSEQRLSPVDYGPHNMIFRDNGDIVFVDFEYFGWDDPAREIADFVNHDQTKEISEEMKKLYIATYLASSNASDAFIERLQIVIKLIAIEWLTIHLYAMTPEKTKSRQFAVKDFNSELYFDEQIAKFQERMTGLTSPSVIISP